MSKFIKFYFTSSILDMFRTFLHPSSRPCDFSIVSPHWLCVLVSMCVGVAGWCGTRVAGFILPHGYHPNQPHLKIQHTSKHEHTSMWWYNRKVAGSWWWMCKCPKYFEHRRSEIKLNKLWHQVGVLFFSYHNDARSNIYWMFMNFDIWFLAEKLYFIQIWQE